MKYILYLTLFSCSFFYSCSSDSEMESPSTPNAPEVVEEEEDLLPEAPAFSLEALGGSTLSLDQFEDRVLVIFFFGHNCPPCITAGPTLEEELNNVFSSNSDFSMIGIDVWDGNTAQVENFQSRTSTTYPLGLRGSDVGSAFDSARDRLVVINREGRIAFSGNQIAINDLEEVTDLLNTLF